MTRTKEELKHGLTMCSKDIGQAVCKECAYNVGNDLCMVELNRDALEYILELEEQVREAKAAIPESLAGTCRYALQKLLKNNRKQEAYWEKMAKEKPESEFRQRAWENARECTAKTLATLETLGWKEK